MKLRLSALVLAGAVVMCAVIGLVHGRLGFESLWTESDSVLIDGGLIDGALNEGALNEGALNEGELSVDWLNVDSRSVPRLIADIFGLGLAQHDAVRRFASDSELQLLEDALAANDRLRVKVEEAALRLSPASASPSAVSELLGSVDVLGHELRSFSTSAPSWMPPDAESRLLRGLDGLDSSLHRFARETNTALLARPPSGIAWATGYLITLGAALVLFAFWLRALVRQAFTQERERHAMLVSQSLEHHVNNALAVIVTNAHLLTQPGMSGETKTEVESEIDPMSRRIRDGIHSLRDYRTLERESFGMAGEVLKLKSARTHAAER